jgi:hypothetical protein
MQQWQQQKQKVVAGKPLGGLGGKGDYSPVWLCCGEQQGL